MVSRKCQSRNASAIPEIRACGEIKADQAPRSVEPQLALAHGGLVFAELGQGWLMGWAFGDTFGIYALWLRGEEKSCLMLSVRTG